jgi:hypothetical protein
LNTTGARTSKSDATRTATVIWAALNGAFLLMDDVKIFRDITGLEASRLLEETFEFQLAAAEAAAAARPRRRSVKTQRGGGFADQHNGAAAHTMQAHRNESQLND